MGFLWRLMVVFACAAWLGAWDYYGTIDEEPPGGRDFWYGTTTGVVLLFAVPFVLAAAVGRFWALFAAAGIVIDRVQLALRGERGDFGDFREPLLNPLLWVYAIPFVLAVLALGVLTGRGFRSLRPRLAGNGREAR